MLAPNRNLMFQMRDLAQQFMTEASYLARHNSMALGVGLTAAFWNRLLQANDRPDLVVRTMLRHRLKQLLLDDLQNVRAGYYPADLLSQMPIGQYLKRLPDAITEFPKIWLRKRRQGFDDLPADVNIDDYPAYYRRTFHWQTDGWLSNRSAQLYDPGVEFLFGGTADIMRRMAIPPLVDAIAHLDRPKVLDVACGTGRFIQQAGTALPNAQLTGLDMSPFYVDYARKNVCTPAQTSWQCGRGEQLPMSDETYDAAVSVFLFHELPKNIRRQVLHEMYRVLKPGGTLILLDSAQTTDSQELSDVLRHFPETYHEPYYKSYLKDDLAAMTDECGFSVGPCSHVFVSRLVVATKPH